MMTVSGTLNHLPVKVNHLDEFIPLLDTKKITYKFVGSLMGYFVYEFISEADKLKALKLRDKIYKTNKL